MTFLETLRFLRNLWGRRLLCGPIFYFFSSLLIHVCLVFFLPFPLNLCRDLIDHLAGQAAHSADSLDGLGLGMPLFYELDQHPLNDILAFKELYGSEFIEGSMGFDYSPCENISRCFTESPAPIVYLHEHFLDLGRIGQMAGQIFR